METEKPKLLEFKPTKEKDPISIEVTVVEGESGVEQAGRYKLSFEEMLQKVKPFCESIISNFQGLTVRPDSASAEFGMKVSAEGNLFIVKSSGLVIVKKKQHSS